MVKRVLMFAGVLLVLAGLASGIGFVLREVDRRAAEGPVAAVEEEVLGEIQIFKLLTVAAPLLLDGKVGRYVNIEARYEIASDQGMERARDLLPRLRDDLVRGLHKNPVPLSGDGRSLDMNEVRKRFLISGRKFIGERTVQAVVVEVAGTRPRLVQPQQEEEPAGGDDH